MCIRYKILLGVVLTFQMLLILLQLFDIVWFCEWYWLLWPVYLFIISELIIGIYGIRHKLKIHWTQFKSDVYKLWWKD